MNAAKQFGVGLYTGKPFALSGKLRTSRAVGLHGVAAMSKTTWVEGGLPDCSRVKGVLFDIDGTLTNSDPLHFAAFQKILVEVGFQGGQPITEAFFRSHISGRHNPEIAADLFPDWPEEKRVHFYEDKEQRFRDMAADCLHRMPGLTEFLGWCDARGLPSVAVTNAPKDNALLMLGALGLKGYFQALILGEECSRPKPFPDPYQKGLQLLGLQPQEALVVEDSPAGVQAAVAAGVPVVGISSGQEPEVLLAAGACVVVKDFHQLLTMVMAQGAAAPAGAAGSSNKGGTGPIGVTVVASSRAAAGTD